jgi:hypothetical protein
MQITCRVVDVILVMLHEAVLVVVFTDMPLDGEIVPVSVNVTGTALPMSP